MAGVEEIIVKNGELAGNRYATMEEARRRWIAVHACCTPADTTGAGDSFNGSYLAARLAGLQALKRRARPHAKLAAAVVRKCGARWRRSSATRGVRRLTPLAEQLYSVTWRVDLPGHSRLQEIRAVRA